MSTPIEFEDAYYADLESAQPAPAGQTILQVRLRQIHRSLPEHFVLLLEQTVPTPQLSRLRAIVRGLTGPVTYLDIGLTEPVLQRRLTDTKVSRDLF